MQGNDGVTYNVGKSGAIPHRKHETALITLERFQKLDLLIHLITNLKSSLVLCGPKGIGKTRLLTELKISKKNEWPIITIQGSSNLSFESLQDQLSKFAKQYFPENNNPNFSGLLNSLDKANQKIVLIIDDAGQLMPGLIEMIIQYAASNSCLRIIFSLTHDELHIKNSSDKSIDDCHYIEMPPLTEKQCGIFLQSLSAQPNATVSFKAINDRLIGKLYKETHGIPGKIVSELPKLSNYNTGSSYKWFGFVIVGGAAIFIASTFSSKETDLPTFDKVNLPLLLKEPNNEEIINPVIDRVVLANGKDKVIDQVQEKIQKITSFQDNVSVTTSTLIEVNKNTPFIGIQPKKSAEIIDVQKITYQNDVHQRSEDKKIKVVEADKKPTVDLINAISEVENKKKLEELNKSADKKINPILQQEKSAEFKDRGWILKQPQQNFTIQLMVLSQLRSVHTFMKKNKSLNNRLKFFDISKEAKKQYVLIYGSFKNANEATEKMKTLPRKFRKSWVRKFKTLQKLLLN